MEIDPPPPLEVGKVKSRKVKSKKGWKMEKLNVFGNARSRKAGSREAGSRGAPLASGIFIFVTLHIFANGSHFVALDRLWMTKTGSKICCTPLSYTFSES